MNKFDLFNLYLNSKPYEHPLSTIVLAMNDEDNDNAPLLYYVKHGLRKVN